MAKNKTAKRAPTQMVGYQPMGRLFLHESYDRTYDPKTPRKRANIQLEDRSVRDYHQKGKLPDSRVPDNLPGVFD